MNRSDISKNNSNLFNVSGKIKFNGLMTGSTYDNRKKVNFDNDSINSIYINQTISPKEAAIISHASESKRKPNPSNILKV